MPVAQSNLTNMATPNPNTNPNRDESRGLDNTNTRTHNDHTHNKTNLGGRVDNNNANLRGGQGSIDDSNYDKNTQRELSGGVERDNLGMRDEIQGAVGGNNRR